MTKELTYETIPNEYWPKCFWCGLDLGDSTIEVKTRFATRNICSECQDIVTAILTNITPIMLGELLIRAGERECTGRYISIHEVKDMSIQRMKEAEEV